MNAAKKKLKSGSGATILMALLFFLVAAMVSAVIISAAATAAQTLKARREHQQAYLTCSSAAQYIRDALQGEGYKVVFEQEVYTDETVVEENKSNDPKDQAKRQDRDILKLIDSLFAEKMSGTKSDTLFTDEKPAQKTVTLQVEDCAPVQVQLSLTREKPDQDSTRTYLLTADCRVEEGSPAQCWVVLKMPCVIQETETEVDASAPGALSRRITYQVQWQQDSATIFRDGLVEVTQ